MARSVTFNGVTRYRPGAITRVNAEGLNQVGVSASGVLALVGEATGGAPGSEGLVSLRDPSQAEDTFRDGALVDAIKLAFESSGDLLIPGGAAEVLVYKTNASSQASINVPSDNVSIVSTTVSTATNTVLTVVDSLVSGELVGRWVEVSVASSGDTFLRRITANDTTTITITPALPTVPAAADTVEVRANLLRVSSRDYGEHTNTIEVSLDHNTTDDSYQVVVEFEDQEQMSPTLGGTSRNYLHVVYRGGAIAATSTVATGATTSVISTTGLTAAAHDGQTVVVKDSFGNVKAISKVATNTATEVTLDVPLLEAPDTGDLMEFLAVTDVVGEITGASGLATTFQTTVTGVTGDDLNIAITPTMTLRSLAALINANPNYLATVPSAVNADTSLASAFDFGAATSVNLQTSYGDTESTTGFRQDITEVLRWINEEAQYITAERATEASEDGGKLNQADYPGTTGDPLPWVFRLSGGSRGVSTNASFQDGLDELLRHVVDEVVPLIDQDMVEEGNGSTATLTAVAAQLKDHVTAARGAVGHSRGSWLGVRGTKTQVIALANTVNDPDVHIVAQNPTVVSTSGDLTEKGPREFAVMGASMRLGVPEVGEPLTHKYLRVTSVSQDASWDPRDATDAADMILGGVMFAETVAAQGTRWVRDLTSWVRDDNLAYSEGSVRDVVRFVENETRTMIENRFTGRKATPATVSSVKDAVVALMEVFRTDNVIVDSTDPATGRVVKAYHNLKVFSTGDIIRINFGIFPVPGINFQLIDLYLSLASQAA